MNVLIGIFALLLFVFLVNDIREKLIDMRDVVGDYQNQSKKLINWSKKRAVITDVLMNAHLMENDDANLERLVLTENIRIDYEYFTSNGKTSSMSVTNFPLSSVYERLVKLKIGSDVPVWVNPNNENESYLIIPNNDDFSDFKGKLISEMLPQIAIAQLMLFLLLYLIIK
ncbi:hypothetical protein B9J93_01805 [Vibrio sp. V17_P4S1T151]|uniref:DUF3592 domain-containing protein n=1 Tax=unclassified Vibrio TaxID=2614977 RepID=UPI000B8E5F97|nr:MULTISPECIES: hypothetical protein [unclassified Vibrio]OXX49802.1 hypothetical protein B9J93_01805 [Vibrio sp. V17_P4S1T151]OXX64872.1 hypothetical protein B9J89_03080 [Vibrio sp. V15_P4S5T153]